MNGDVRRDGRSQVSTPPTQWPPTPKHAPTEPPPHGEGMDRSPPEERPALEPKELCSIEHGGWTGRRSRVGSPAAARGSGRRAVVGVEPFSWSNPWGTLLSVQRSEAEQAQLTARTSGIRCIPERPSRVRVTPGANRKSLPFYRSAAAVGGRSGSARPPPPSPRPTRGGPASRWVAARCRSGAVRAGR